MLINKQIEQSLTEGIQSLYITRLGHQPAEIACHFFEDKLAIFLEDALTRPEQLLFARGRTDLAQQIRQGLHEILKPEIKAFVETTLQSTVIEVIMAAQFDTKHVSFIAVLKMP